MNVIVTTGVELLLNIAISYGNYVDTDTFDIINVLLTNC